MLGRPLERVCEVVGLGLGVRGQTGAVCGLEGCVDGDRLEQFHVFSQFSSELQLRTKGWDLPGPVNVMAFSSSLQGSDKGGRVSVSV